MKILLPIVLILLAGCGTPKLYAETGLGAALPYTHPSLRSSSDPSVHLEAGLEWRNGFHCGISHDSYLRDGFPFNDRKEIWRDEIRCGGRWGGY